MYVCMYVSAFCRGMRVECDDMCVRVGGGGGGRRQEAGGGGAKGRPPPYQVPGGTVCILEY